MNTSTIIHSLGGAIAVSLLAPSIALAGENPFAMQSVTNGMQLSEMSKGSEGKCGEGKCGAKGAKKTMEKTSEGKCGEGKCGDNQASSKKAMEKTGEGKCGEGKCGDKS